MRWQWAKLDELSAAELYAALALRQQVFVVEQQCAYLDADGLDSAAHHLLGWEGDGLAAYLRAVPPERASGHAAIGRVVVAPRFRKRGLGRTLVQEGMHRARETFGAGPLCAEVQEHLEAFYRSLGFEVVGPGYLEDGIPHLPMRTRG